MQQSFEPGVAADGPAGQRAHPDLIEHTARLERRFYTLGEHAWSLVGNGLSNQTFVEGPEGIIAIDTGECVEEMRAALVELRRVTDKPVVACLYTHFHYVNGTRALLEDGAATTLPIISHVGVPGNLRRFGGEVGPRYARGLVHQFGVVLPDSGEDGLVNVGLGLHFRSPDHAPYTPGYLPPTTTFEERLEVELAGLRVELTHAPSDADDSVTIWFPELGLAVNNLLWPALFNVFAIRGEEYRDPRILLTGLDHLRALGAQSLAGAHGAPLTSATEIDAALLDYRDAIQFLWDQTVRGANNGLNADEIATTVNLPGRFRRTHFTRQFYGLVEHHVRQIYAGLFGWFDEDDAHLFPLPPAERAARLIEGFGGAEAVRAQVDTALAAADLRWALELASWLVRVGPANEADCGRLAAALRQIAQSTTSSNVRNWCVTRARTLEGQLDVARFRGHRIRVGEVLAAEPGTYVQVLRVMLDPERAAAVDTRVAWVFEDGVRAGLHVRGGVAVPFEEGEADVALHLSLATWAQIAGGKQSLTAAEESGLVRIEGDRQQLMLALQCFDHPSLGR